MNADKYILDGRCSVGVWAVSPDTTIQSEVYIYPWTSLVAEFGGTLGLFIGFSFMSLWDGLELAVRVSKKIGTILASDRA